MIVQCSIWERHVQLRQCTLLQYLSSSWWRWDHQRRLSAVFLASTGDSRRQVLTTNVSSLLNAIELPKHRGYCITNPTTTNWIKAIKKEKTNEKSDRNQMDRLQSYADKDKKEGEVYSEPINPLNSPNEHCWQAQFIKERTSLRWWLKKVTRWWLAAMKEVMLLLQKQVTPVWAWFEQTIASLSAPPCNCQSQPVEGLEYCFLASPVSLSVCRMYVFSAIKHNRTKWRFSNKRLH